MKSMHTSYCKAKQKSQHLVRSREPQEEEEKYEIQPPTSVVRHSFLSNVAENGATASIV